MLPQARRWAVLLAMLLFVFAFWPFAFERACRVCPNAAELLPDQSVLAFPGPGYASAGALPAPVVDRLVNATGLTIELRLAPGRLDQSGPARILSFAGDPRRANLVVGQSRDALIFRLRTTRSSLSGRTREFVARDVFTSTEPLDLAITCVATNCDLFVDGRLHTRMSAPRGSYAAWDRSYPLVFGNEASGTRPWEGQLFGVVLHDRALDAEVVAGRRLSETDLPHRGSVVARFAFCSPPGLTFAAAGDAGQPIGLMLPPRFVDREVSVFMTIRHRDAADIAKNFLVWLPLAFALVLVSQRTPGRPDRSLRIFLGLALAAIATEMAQHVIDGRTGSAVDLVAALCGLSTGVVTARKSLAEIARRRLVLGVS